MVSPTDSNTGALTPSKFDGEGIDGRVIGALVNTLTLPGLVVSYSKNFEHPGGESSLADITDDVPEPWCVEELVR